MFLPESWRWWTTLDSEVPSLPDTLWALLTSRICLYGLEHGLVILPDCWGYCILREIFWTIGLQHLHQLKHRMFLVVSTELCCPVSWDCRIHRLHLCRWVKPRPNECPEYDIKQFNAEVPVMLKLWRMQSTPSLPLPPGLLWPGMVTPDRVLSMG